MNVRRRDDRGTVLLLTVGLAAVAIGLIITMVDATALYLGRRAVAAAADATALAAAQGADEAAVYAGRGSVNLPLSVSAAQRVASEFVASAGLASKLPGFRLEAVTTDGRSVRVVISARVRLPFVGLVATSDGTVAVRAAARAMSPVR